MFYFRCERLMFYAGQEGLESRHETNAAELPPSAPSFQFNKLATVCTVRLRPCDEAFESCLCESGDGFHPEEHREVQLLKAVPAKVVQVVILQTGSPISSRFFGVISLAIDCVRIR